MTKVVFETATLADAIKKAARIAPTRGAAFDKAAGIVLDVSQHPLPCVVRATDLDVFSMEWIEPVEMEGDPVAWRLPSISFSTVMASLPIGTGKLVTLEEKENGHSSQVHLTSGRTKARFNTLDIGYYPEWSAYDPDELYKANDLGGRFAMVSWAAGKSDVPLNGVHLTGEIAVATDKYKLCCAPMPIPELTDPITVPATVIASMLKATGEVAIGAKGNFLHIMPDEYTQLKAIIYAEKYPGVTRIMQREYPEKLTVNKEALLEILNRAANFAGADRTPTLRCFIGKQEFAVWMPNEEVGMLGDILDIPGYADHDRWEVKFTPKYLIEAISNVPSSEFDMHYDPSNPKRVVYIDGGSGYECWVMPRGDIARSDG